MARRRHQKKRNPVLEYRQLPTEELHRRIRGCREAGNFRVAIDLAKQCHRRAPTPDHARLLGELYLQRGRQLIDKNLHTEALTVLHNALDLGQGSVELLRLVFECGVRSGQYASALSAFKRMRDPAERARASSMLVDKAVAGGEAVGRLCEPALRDDAARIRRAFAAFEQGDETTVAAELKPIGLNSPAAGWKWLLRGLTAYTRGEQDRADSSWKRVGVDGQAGRLSELLRSALLSEKSSPSQLPLGLRAKAMSRLANPRVFLLRQIREALGAGEEDEALELCGKLLAKVAVEDREAYARRLGRAVCPVMGDDEQTTRRFAYFFGALPEDPRLIRTAALSAEARDPHEAIGLWRYYLRTINEVKVIPAGLNSRARAMIWQRMGDLAQEAVEYDEVLPDPFLGPDLGEATDPARCYRQSLKHYPDDLRTHEKLMAVFVRRNNRKQAERAAHEILKRWPHHVDSLTLLGTNCLDRHALRKALGFFEQARQAEPFNGRIRSRMQLCFLLSARRRLDNNNLQLARKDYEQAEALGDPQESSAFLYCKWAALEWRAGDEARAQELLERAQACGDDPVLVYFHLVVELDRAEAPQEVQKRFRQLLEHHWQGEPTAAAAAGMAELLVQLEAMKVRHRQRPQHDRALVDYLRRARRQVTFSEEQLLPVCAYLESVEAWEVLQGLAEQGAGAFPGNYLFPMLLARAQRGLGRRRLPRATCRLLQRAGRQAVQEGNLKAGMEIAALLSGGPRVGRGLLSRFLDLVSGLSPGYEPLDGDQLPAMPDPRPGRRRKRNRRASDQMFLFDDLFASQAEER